MHSFQNKRTNEAEDYPKGSNRIFKINRISREKWDGGLTRIRKREID